jgi:hypothetical protein
MPQQNKPKKPTQVTPRPAEVSKDKRTFKNKNK